MSESQITPAGPREKHKYICVLMDEENHFAASSKDEKSKESGHVRYKCRYREKVSVGSYRAIG